MTVKKKKYACGTWSPPDVIPEVKQVDTISCYPQTAAGKEKPRSGPHSNVSFLLARSVTINICHIFNPSRNLSKFERAIMTSGVTKVLVNTCSAD